VEREIRAIDKGDWSQLRTYGAYAVQVKGRKVEAVKCFPSSIELGMYTAQLKEFAGATEKIPQGTVRKPFVEPERKAAPVTGYKKEDRVMLDKFGLGALQAAVVEGAKMGAAREVEEILVGQIRDLLGDSYPAFFKSKVGAAIEPAFCAYVVRLAATNFAEHVPMADVVIEGCDLVIKGASYEATRLLAAAVLPAFKNLGASLLAKGVKAPAKL
jgi:hypothetical protein